MARTLDRSLTAAALALALAAASCSEGGSSSLSCKKDTECPKGMYCGANSRCATDCLAPKDCPTGMTCSDKGKCVTARDQGSDAVTDTRPGGDLPSGKDVTPWVDQSPAKDVKPWVDQPKLVDLPKGDLPKGDLPIKPDLKKPDLGKQDGTPVTGCAGIIGKVCTSAGGQCGTAGSCLLTSSTAGICTCTCTTDDPATPLVNEDNCPDLSKNICGKVVLTGGTTQNYCLRKCNPKIGSNDCAAGIACDPASGSYVGLWQHTVCLFPGCTKDADCPVITSTICDTATTPCATGQTCVALASTTTAGRCAKAGKCDLVSGLCGVHALGKATAKVGDPCKDDTECAGNMTCAFEMDMAKVGAKKGGVACTKNSECCSDSCSMTCATGLCTVNNRNGYCVISGCQFPTLTPFACPAGSTCNILYLAGRCQKTCALAQKSDCRGNAADYFGDYECRAWDNLTLGGVPIAASPVCDFGTSVPCNLLGTTLDCTDLGDSTNSTKMGCRTLDNKVTANIHDPTGFCFDDTASGTQIRSPLPTP